MAKTAFKIIAFGENLCVLSITKSLKGPDLCWATSHKKNPAQCTLKLSPYPEINIAAQCTQPVSRD